MWTGSGLWEIPSNVRENSALWYLEQVLRRYVTLVIYSWNTSLFVLSQTNITEDGEFEHITLLKIVKVIIFPWKIFSYLIMIATFDR